MLDLFRDSAALILAELQASLVRIAGEQVDALAPALRAARRILLTGAGRMGILLNTFCMRLNHLGFSAHMVGSTTCPPVGADDLLLVASSSGETATVREIVKKAKEQRAAIALITAAPDSSIAAMATRVVHVQAPASIAPAATDPLVSKQPMKTLFEQTLFITCEAVVLMLMRQTGQDAADMSRRHGNLE